MVNTRRKNTGPATRSAAPPRIQLNRPKTVKGSKPKANSDPTNNGQDGRAAVNAGISVKYVLMFFSSILLLFRPIC